jgi:single-strand DNA-binding protein
MNLGCFVGHVGKDCKLEITQGGKAVASFSLAIDNGKNGDGQKRDPIWIKCVLWEKKAEALAQHVTKGKMVAVSGPVHVEAWIGNHSEALAAIVCTVREFTFCGAPQHPADSKPRKAA